MHFIYILDFYAFQSVFFATIFNKHVIHNSYFFSDFGAGKNMIDPYVILAMPFNSILSCNLSFVLSKYPMYIMVMPLDFSYVRHTMYIVI